MKVRLTLVSASPRRAELLKELGVPFDILPSVAAEIWHGHNAAAIVIENAVRKVKRSAKYGDRFRLLLGADTLISCESLLLGKPQGVDSARRMLSLLSGKRHQVCTGICLSGPGPSGQAIMDCTGEAESVVEFSKLAEPELRTYLNSREWEGKAGAYAIQGAAKQFAHLIGGARDNVVGLPLDKVNEILRVEFGHLELC